MAKSQVTASCVLCKETFHLQVEKEDWNKLKNGEHIQDIMPYLTPGERELLISGFCNDCFDDIKVPFE